MTQRRRDAEKAKQRLVWRSSFTLVLFLAFAAFLRLYQIDSIPPALCSDEAHNGNDILESLETGHFRIFYPQNGGREGLFINIQGMFVSILGNKPWVLRLPSALIGIATVWGVYWLAAECFSIPVGLAASFFLDLPTGAAIVCACGLLLILVTIVGSLRRA